MHGDASQHFWIIQLYFTKTNRVTTHWDVCVPIFLVSYIYCRHTIHFPLVHKEQVGCLSYTRSKCLSVSMLNVVYYAAHKADKNDRRLKSDNLLQNIGV